MRKEMRIAGYGGQGVVTLSMLIATAASLEAGKFAVQTDAYGPTARGGACYADVVIDDEEIDYPGIIKPDYLILFSKDAVSSYARSIKSDGIILFDPTTVKKVPGKAKKYGLPVQQIALDEFGKSVFANVIMFAAFLKITDLLPLDAARNIVKQSVPQKALDINMKAFDRGIELAEGLMSAE